MDARVLVVDDDPVLLEALSEALRLRMDRLVVETSNSAPAALGLIAAREYDAVVADIRMPGMDGLELLAEIKKRQPDVPTLLITGHGDHDVAVQALRGGAFDYVTKPIDRGYFVSSLERAIQCQRLARDVVLQRQELERQAKELEQCVQDRAHELRDLLHREQLARAELDTVNRKLEEANRQREAFISMIVHDLRQPLMTLAGFAQLLGRSNISPEKREQAHSILLSEARRMARLVSDLAETVSLSEVDFAIQPTTCNLTEIVREQVELARVGSERHTISLEAPPELIVPCDPDRLGQVLANLLTNAMKYAPNGQISVRVWQEEHEARFSVSDEGPGIPPEDVAAIFEPGYRLMNEVSEGQSEGQGLGLHIVRGLISAHGGQIWVESTPGHGATFHVSLPIVLPEAVATQNEKMSATNH